jgi:hypothetical protein
VKKKINKLRVERKIPSMILTGILRVRAPIIEIAQVMEMGPSLQRLRKVIRVEMAQMPKT